MTTTAFTGGGPGGGFSPHTFHAAYPAALAPTLPPMMYFQGSPGTRGAGGRGTNDNTDLGFSHATSE